jgi:endonuclease III
MNAQSIYADLQTDDNKKLWAYAQELAEFRRKSEKVKNASIDLSDKDGLRDTVMEHLFDQSAKGNAQASDKLAKLAGLTEDTADIVIESVNFAEAVWELEG